jgi:hypothetical protein
MLTFKIHSDGIASACPITRQSVQRQRHLTMTFPHTESMLDTVRFLLAYCLDPPTVTVLQSL